MNYVVRNFGALVAICGMSLNSCSLFDPSSPVASYIRVDSISVTTDYLTEGSNSKRITDCWVFLDGTYFGTFPLPAEIPLTGEGNHTIALKAGIVENGINASRAAYPKYNSFDTTMSLTGGETVNISPVVTYGSSLAFIQLEDFDDASLSLSSTTSGEAPMQITSLSDPDAFEGNSGYAVLDTANDVFEVASSTPFLLPLNVPTYIELDYKSEVDFSVGTFITTTSGVIQTEVLSIRATDTWKKIYITLSTLGGVSTEGIEYKIYLHANKPAFSSSAKLYFDNLKVVF